MSISIDWDWDKSFSENAQILNSQEHERRLNAAARVMARDLGVDIEDQLTWAVSKSLPRWRACHLSMSKLVGLITLGQNQQIQIFCDLPEGAKVVRWFIDPSKDGITVFFEHPTFPEVEEGAIIPPGPPVEFRITLDGPSQASQARR